uniref:uncharacterized protein LOC109956816 n=1 Tax=Monopterus albus TaxID=43700 RepID=UPI0009B3BED6|nr:uncharacterized protein LOC109956816 [Monopterus albus]
MMETVLGIFQKGKTMAEAFNKFGVDRNTISQTSEIAELAIAAPEKWHHVSTSIITHHHLHLPLITSKFSSHIYTLFPFISRWFVTHVYTHLLSDLLPDTLPDSLALHLPVLHILAILVLCSCSPFLAVHSPVFHSPALHSQVVSTYSCRTRVNRWPLALFHNTLDVSLFNSYILWTVIQPCWNQNKSYQRKLFIEQVGETLVRAHILQRERLPRTPGAAGVMADLWGPAAGPSKTKGRKQCFFCKEKKQAGNICCKCKKYLCKDHCLTIFSHCCA